MTAHPPRGELWRPLDISALAREGMVKLAIEASPAECAAIAARLGIPAIGRLMAALSVEAEGPEGARLHGLLRAEVTQTCVVTLEPVTAQIEEPLEARFASGAPGPSLETLDPEAADPPEPLPPDGIIEAGELIVQCLSLALDPYPRKPGARFAQAEDPAGTASPFAKLAALKPGQKGG